MSRGHGKVQREVLAHLDRPDAERWTTIREVAGAGATDSRIKSVRRAVARLEDAGRVEVTIVSRQINGYTTWLVAARLALHEDTFGTDTLGDPIRRRRRDVEQDQERIWRRRTVERDIEVLRRKLGITAQQT